MSEVSVPEHATSGAPSFSIFAEGLVNALQGGGIGQLNSTLAIVDELVTEVYGGRLEVVESALGGASIRIVLEDGQR